MEQAFAGMVHATEGTSEPELDNLGCNLLAVAGRSPPARILDCTLLAAGSGVRIARPVDRSRRLLPAESRLRLPVLQNKIVYKGKEMIMAFKTIR
jgi:hypothetical protein